MATTKENQDKKKVNNQSEAKAIQQKVNQNEANDPAQKKSSNVGKGPAGENL